MPLWRDEMNRLHQISLRLQTLENAQYIAKETGDRRELLEIGKVIIDNAPADLDYLVNFGKAAKEALELALPVLRADKPPTITELDMARKALALLEGGGS